MANEEDIIRLRIPSRDLIVAAVLSMILPPIIMAIDPKPVRFMLSYPHIISASYALLSALITGFHEREEAPEESLPQLSRDGPSTYSGSMLLPGIRPLFLGITGVISSPYSLHKKVKEKDKAYGVPEEERSRHP